MLERPGGAVEREVGAREREAGVGEVIVAGGGGDK